MKNLSFVSWLIVISIFIVGCGGNSSQQSDERTRVQLQVLNQNASNAMQQMQAFNTLKSTAAGFNEIDKRPFTELSMVSPPSF